MSYSFFEKPDKFASIADEIQHGVVERLATLDKFKDAKDPEPDPNSDFKKALALTSNLLDLYKKATSRSFRGKSVSAESAAESVVEPVKESDSADHTTLPRPQ